MRKIFGLIMLFAISLMLVGCGKKETEKNAIIFDLAVYDKNDTLIYEKQIETEESKLLAALKKVDGLKLGTEDSEYGEFIIAINEVNQEENYFWNYYINDDYASVGAESYKLKENDKIEFRLEKFE